MESEKKQEATPKKQKKKEVKQKKEKKKGSKKRDNKNITILERSEQNIADKTGNTTRLDNIQRNILDIEIPGYDPFKISTDNSLILNPLNYPRKVIKILKIVRESPRSYVIVQFADEESSSKLDVEVARFICPELLTDFLLTKLKDHSQNNH